MMSQTFSIVILAGGKSSRMGEDKGLISLQGEHMISPILKVAQHFTNNIYISTQNLAYSKFGYLLIQDVIIDKGPLGGILSALQKTNSKDILFLSCDVPFVTIDVIDKLILNHETGKISVVKHGDKIHPLIGIYSHECADLIKLQIENEDFKVMNLLSKFPTNYIDMSDVDTKIFSNINSKNDL